MRDGPDRAEHPYQAIIDTTVSNGCDLTVMASHARLCSSDSRISISLNLFIDGACTTFPGSLWVRMVPSQLPCVAFSLLGAIWHVVGLTGPLWALCCRSQPPIWY
jgi:hypothetical protein